MTDPRKAVLDALETGWSRSAQVRDAVSFEQLAIIRESLTSPAPMPSAEIDAAIEYMTGYINNYGQNDEEFNGHVRNIIQAAKSAVPSGGDRWCNEDSTEVLRARAMGFKVKVGKHKSVWFEDDLGRMSEQAFWSQRELVFYMNGFDAANRTKKLLLDRGHELPGE